MKLSNIGDVIASRSLMLNSDDGTKSEVLALLGKPLQDGRDFYCPYQIKGAGDEKVRGSYGIDAIQALHLAIRNLGVEVEVLNKELGGKLRWESGDVADFGFPAI
jgi:hypothetical protein